jgi:hypothetical protein
MRCGGRIVAAILIGKQPAELTANKLADARLPWIGASSETPSDSPDPRVDPRPLPRLTRLPTFPPKSGRSLSP